MPNTFAAHHIQFAVFATLFVAVTVLGFFAARWRRPHFPESLEQWGLGGRSFGNFMTWFLLGGGLFTAYTFVAIPAEIYRGGAGFFAVSFAVIAVPLAYLALCKFWSVVHVHGFVTPSEFVKARFGSPGLAALVAATAIVATMPYVALQLVGLEAVLKVMGINGKWPLWVAFGLLALYTFRAGLRAPALISVVKDVLMLWTVLAAVVTVAMLSGAWGGFFHDAGTKFASAKPVTATMVLPDIGQFGYVTLALGSALGLFLYPHAVTGILAANGRKVVKRNLAALPVYTAVLAVMALLGYVATAWPIVGADGTTRYGIAPVANDPNTVIPALFDTIFPSWCAGLAFAAIGIGALVPAAIMSIAASNLFSRSIYREYLRPNASAVEETLVSKIASVSVLAGALLVIVLLRTQFAVDFQLIGGVLILQIMPALGIALYSAWLHRWALIAGLLGGLLTGLVMLYRISGTNVDGTVRAHFGGSSYKLADLGFDSKQTVYVGIVALLVNLVICVVGTVVLRVIGVPAGADATLPDDYFVEEGGTQIRRAPELADDVASASVGLR